MSEMPDLPLIVAITGASGAILGIRALELLREAGVVSHLIVTAAARVTIAHETGRTVAEVEALAQAAYRPDNLTAPIASGSFQNRGMLIVPCSIKTLSAVANSYTSDLVTRSADVCLKEGRPVLLAVRETPLTRGHLRLMDLAARSGAIIFPPAPVFYGRPQTVDELVTALAARMLLRLGIDTPGYPRWLGLDSDN